MTDLLHLGSPVSWDMFAGLTTYEQQQKIAQMDAFKNLDAQKHIEILSELAHYEIIKKEFAAASVTSKQEILSREEMRARMRGFSALYKNFYNACLNTTTKASSSVASPAGSQQKTPDSSSPASGGMFAELSKLFQGSVGEKGSAANPLFNLFGGKQGNPLTDLLANTKASGAKGKAVADQLGFFGEFFSIVAKDGFGVLSLVTSFFGGMQSLVDNLGKTLNPGVALDKEEILKDPENAEAAALFADCTVEIANQGPEGQIAAKHLNAAWRKKPNAESVWKKLFASLDRNNLTDTKLDGYHA